MSTQVAGKRWTISVDDTPWTEGDAELAVAYGEKFGETEIMFPILDEQQDVICRCVWRPCDTAEEQKVLRANARLIAAAPELLQALKDAEQMIIKLAQVVYKKEIADHLPFGLLEETQEWIRHSPVDAAVRKAEGE